MKFDYTGLSRIYQRAEQIQLEFTEDEKEKKLMRAAIALKAEVLKVIRDYNRGVLVREHQGFVFDAMSAEEMRNRENGPLIDEGFYVANWHADTEKLMGNLIGSVFTNTEYAWWLETGNSRMEGYHVMAIAMVRAKPKIRRILFGRKRKNTNFTIKREDEK